MQDLHLIGVHDDGEHLILSDDDGQRFRVPLDESLRAAARRDRPRLGQLQIEIDGGMRPRDVQALIRAGHSAEDVADRAGWTVEKVHRYEGPILAERAHVANLAKQVRLRPRSGSHGSAPTLAARVAERMESRQIDPEIAQWDAHRREKGQWVVILAFAAGGRERTAGWDFDQVTRTVSARDDEARWLSADEDTPSPGPLAAPHLTEGRSTRVYDVEAEGGIDGARPRASRSGQGESIDLMAAMRERRAERGRRRRPKSATTVPGIETAPDDALPLEELAMSLEEAGPPPAAHPHPNDEDLAPSAGVIDEIDGDEDITADITAVSPPDAADAGDAESDAGVGEFDADDADVVDDDDDDDPYEPIGLFDDDVEDDEDDDVEDDEEQSADIADDPELPGESPNPQSESGRRVADAVVRKQHEREADSEAPEAVGSDAASPADADAEPAPAPKPKPPAKPKGRKGRQSVPSWDDIMFGRKPD